VSLLISISREANHSHSRWFSQFSSFPIFRKEAALEFISTRISQAEYQEIVQAAKDSGLTKTKRVRTKLLAAARRA
jgi:hypothetical protein